MELLGCKRREESQDGDCRSQTMPISIKEGTGQGRGSCGAMGDRAAGPRLRLPFALSDPHLCGSRAAHSQGVSATSALPSPLAHPTCWRGAGGGLPASRATLTFINPAGPPSSIRVNILRASAFRYQNTTSLCNEQNAQQMGRFPQARRALSASASLSLSNPCCSAHLPLVASLLRIYKTDT